MAEEANAREIAEELKRHAAECKSLHEENIRQRAEHVLRTKALDRMGIPWALYEYTGKYAVVQGRVDTLYGKVVIEYEPPGKLEKEAGRKHAFQQAIDYIKQEAGVKERWFRYFGVILDGFQIGFVRYRNEQWQTQGPFEVNAQTVLKLLTAIRGLRRKPLKADLLNQDLGPDSLAAKAAIKSLYLGLTRNKSPRVEMLFDDWKRVFEQACGYSPEKIAGLERRYGLEREKNVDYEALLFSLHTYYALVMKLIASEVASLYGGAFLRSYIKKLEDAYLKGPKELHDALEELESGGIFATLGIKNFLEADYFGWYLDVWTKEIIDSVNEVVRALANYDPATMEHDPDAIKDLLKRLYQFLVPREIRYKLGEYYTPDWLAEFVLNEVGYDGNPEKRFLDPACGSGTFLVLAIKRIKEFAEENFYERSRLLDRILENVVGFDLNPLAVIASRTNYLLALGDLINESGGDGIEIPVYLADSILTERRMNVAAEHVYAVKTYVGEFQVPISLVQRGLFDSSLTLIEDCVKNKYETDDFLRRLEKIARLDKPARDVMEKLYEKIIKLEKEGRNRIWTKIIKNSFAPLYKGQFHIVAGNPPWIGWEHLPEEYREASKGLWSHLGLIKKSDGPAMGKAVKEFAMLFVAVCIKKYLRDDGDLALLVPFTVFKAPAGAGFRSFLAKECKVNRVHEMVELAPFEGATNRTSFLVVDKDKRTRFPIPCITWTRQKGKTVDFALSLPEALKITRRTDMILSPIEGEGKPESPWLIVKAEAMGAIKKVLGKSAYTAHKGIMTGLNGVYSVAVSKQAGKLLVENLSESGKTKLKKITRSIERDFLFPLVLGENVKKWIVTPENFIIVPSEEDGKVIPPSTMRSKFPKTYAYFHEFFNDLISRGSEPYKSKLEPYKYKSLKEAERTTPPFYWLFNTEAALAKYKVVWKDTAGKISGKGEFTAAVVPPISSGIAGRKQPTPLHTVIVMPFRDSTEAHYVCSVLNSSPIRLTVASYTMERHISAHVPKHVRIPTFDSRDKRHRKLSELSKKAHKLAAAGKEKELAKVEAQIDREAAPLWKITKEELESIKESLRFLEEGPEEEEVEVEEEAPKPGKKVARSWDAFVEEFKEKK